MLSETAARQFADHWIQAWNSHDLDDIMSHYAAEVVLTSPTAAKLLVDSSGTIKGKEAVRNYFEKGLQAFPNLNFELLDVMWGISSVVLYYLNQKGSKTGEFMEFDANQKIARVRKLHLSFVERRSWHVDRRGNHEFVRQNLCVQTGRSPL
jgi:hypothetical protein